MNVLLTGATGFVGGAVLERLRQHSNYSIRTYGRRVPHGSYENHIMGALEENSDFSDALSGIDVVIHCAAQAHIVEKNSNSENNFERINYTATVNLARQAATAGVKRLIFISSIGVNGSCSHEQAFRYDDKASPWGAYSCSKYAAELALQRLSDETHIEVVIIRPPLVYGFNAPGNFGRLVNAVKKEWFLPMGGINNKRSFVALDNLVDLIFVCSTHPDAANQIFLVSDGHDISTTELLKLMAKAAGKSSRLLFVPIRLLRFIGKLTHKQAVVERLCDNLQVDITHTQEILGWKPPISVEEGIKRCFIEGGK